MANENFCGAAARKLLHVEVGQRARMLTFLGWLWFAIPCPRAGGVPDAEKNRRSVGS